MSFVVERLCGFYLRLSGVHPGGGGDGDQIFITRRKHHQLAGVVVLISGGQFVGPRPTLALKIVPVKYGRGYVGARIEYSHRTNDRGDTRKRKPKAQSGEINLLRTLGCRNADIRKQVTQFLPLCASRRERRVAGKQ